MNRKSLLFAMALLPLLSCGCASLDLFSGGRPKVIKTSKKNPAANMIALWQPSKGATSKGAPTRGFACQVMFFTANDPTPAMVNGKVRVYLFDDVGSPEEQGKPIRQYDFEPDAWNTHAQYSKLGPAYNVFIPYPRPGGHQANCTLTIRYTPADGGPAIFSEESLITLDGTTRERDKQIQQASGLRSEDEKPRAVRQAYKVTHETITPKRVEDSRKKRRTKKKRSSAKRTTKKRTVRNRSQDEELELEEEEVAHELFHEDDFEEERRDSDHPLRRQTRSRDDEYEPEDEELLDYQDEDEDGDEFDRLLRNKRGRSHDHPLESELDSISVDLSRLQSRNAEDESDNRRSSTRQRRARTSRARHPLEKRVTDDFDLEQEDEFDEFDDDGRTFTIRTRR